MPVLVEQVTKTKSGRAYRVLLGGKWYNAFIDSGIEQAQGKYIEAEITTSEKFGPGIQKWAYSNAAPQVPPPMQAGPSPSVPAPAVAAPQYAEPNLNVAPWWMPFVSNSVAHAIAAGHILKPEGIRAWALGAKDAARACVAVTPPTDDSDIPF